MPAKQKLSSKVVVTNRAALASKYGADGVEAIEEAVKALAAADRARGFDTRLVYLDRAAAGDARVRDPADPAENKAAVDAIAKKRRPEYLMILGSHDVVPFQDLKNKLHDPSDPDTDPDRFTGSDLPYACEPPYSQDVTKFLGPTRVVGRLPDMTGAGRPTYLLKLLAAAAKAKGHARPDSAFALSARVWVKSTKTSVRNILGATPTVLISPGKGPTFTRAQLRNRVHFVNCHGDMEDHTFNGEGPKDRYARAMDARKLAGVGAGTVAAFECCYGAQLYDPVGLPAMSIANTYLAKRAAGVLASTTIAYGPEDANANADVICQLFLEQLLRGASLGRALLEARLAYVRQQSVVDPYDEKTLAQFVLLGDPSLHPFPSAAAPAATGGKASAKSGARSSAKAPPPAVHAARLQRRVRLMKAGERLSRETAYTVPADKPARASSRDLKAMKERFGKLRLFEVEDPTPPRDALGKALSKMEKAKHVYVATRRRRTPKESKTPRLEGLLAYQVDGELVEITLQSR